MAGEAIHRAVGDEIRAENFQNNRGVGARIASTEAALRFRYRRIVPCSFFILAVAGVLSTCSQAFSAVACYPAEGNANDVIGGHNGTLVGGVSFAPGKFGQAFSLDGSTGYINLGSSPAFDLG